MVFRLSAVLFLILLCEVRVKSFWKSLLCSCSGEIGSIEAGSGEVGTTEVGKAEVSSAEVGTFEIGFTEVSSVEVSSAEVGTDEVSSVEVGSVEVGTEEVGPAEVSFAEIGSKEVGFTEVGSKEVGKAEIGSTEVGKAEVGPAETGLYVWVVSSPCIPGGHSLLKKIKMTLICHTASPLCSVLSIQACVLGCNSLYPRLSSLPGGVSELLEGGVL
jgi:hypothetical protein